MLEIHTTAKLDYRPETDFKALNLPRPGGSSFDVQIFEETGTQERWIGKCNLQAASKPHARVPYQARYYDEYKEWLGMTLYRLLGVPTPEVVLSLQKVKKVEEDMSSLTKADMEANFDYVNPCQHIMSKFVEGFHPYGEDFLNTYLSSARGQKNYLCIDVALIPDDSQVTTRIPLRGFGAALAVADFLYDLDCVGRCGGNIGYVIERDENGPYAKTIKIDAGLAFNFLEEYKYEEDIKNFEHHPKRRDIIYAPDKALTLHFDQLTKSDQKEFAAMAKHILEIPWSVLEGTIQQVIHKEGFSEKQANKLRQKLLDRKQTFLKAFYPEVDESLRVQVQREREEVLRSLTQKETKVPQKPKKSLITDSGQEDRDSNDVKEKIEKKETQETVASILMSLRQQEQHFGKNQGTLQTIRQLPDEITPRPKKGRGCSIFQQPIVTPFFTGREVMLDAIAKQLQTNQSSIVSQGISGLGGVGKTQLAARYVQLAAENKDIPYDVILWLDATRDIGSQFLTIAYEWFKQEKLSVAEAVAFVYRKLAQHRVLIVFDNVDDEKSLLPYLAPSKTITEKMTHWQLPGNTHILITSRNPDWEVPTLKLDGFTLEEGIEYVRKQLPKATEEEIQALLETVSYLPLALSHAVAYIREGYCTIANYPQQFALHQLSLGGTVTTTESGQTVLTTFLLTLMRLRLAYPAAEKVLKACAYFAPNEIPEDLLQQGLINEKNIKESIRALMQHGLLQLAREDFFNIHSLVQESVRTWQEQGELTQLQRHLKHWATILIAALEYQDNTADIHRVQDFITHALQMATVAQKKFANEDLVEYAGGLFSKVGHHQMYGTQNIDRAHLAYTTLLPILETHYGKDHVQVGVTLMHLGNAYGNLGDPKKKQALLERALIINEAYYGKNHVKVAGTLVNLSNAYSDLGDVQSQKILLERALIINETYYGKNHVEVAVTLASLGNAYGDLGDIQKKKALLERALPILEICYGKNHQKVARTLANLGSAYRTLGDAQKAKTLLESSLIIQETHYGKDHVEVAIILTNLSNAYSALGDTQKQKVLLERALSIKESHYGKDHVEVAITLANLSLAYGGLGDTKKKKILLERVLIIQEAHYGKDHAEVALTLTNLGATYGELGDAQKQKIFLERSLIIQEAYYGKDHVHIAVTLTNLGNAYGKLGDVQKKKALLERALIIKEAHYGKNHAEVAVTLTNLGNAYGALGDTLKQKILLERALSIKEAHYGKNHMQTAITLLNLGNIYDALGDTEKAVSYAIRAYEIFSNSYGQEHTYTQTALQLIMQCQRQSNFQVMQPTTKFFAQTNNPTEKTPLVNNEQVSNPNPQQFCPQIKVDIEIDKLLKKFQNNNEQTLPTVEVALRRAAGYGSKEEVEYLIKKANNIDAVSHTNGQTALHVAVIKGKKDNVEALIAANADPRIQDFSKKTAWDYDSQYKLKGGIKIEQDSPDNSNNSEELSTEELSKFGKGLFLHVPKVVTKIKQDSPDNSDNFEELSTEELSGFDKDLFLHVPKVVTKIEQGSPDNSDNLEESSTKTLSEFGKSSFFYHPDAAALSGESCSIHPSTKIAHQQTKKTTLVPNSKKFSDSKIDQEETLCNSCCSPCSLL